MAHSDSGSSLSDPLDTRNDEGWEDVEPDDEPVSVVSLFDDTRFPNAIDMLHHCKEKHDFDMWQVRKTLDLDFLGMVKLVNYIRTEVKMGNFKPDVSSKAVFEDDSYFKPVLEDDALLFSLDDALDDGGQSPMLSEVEELREQLATLQSQFSAYREDVQKAMGLKIQDSPPTSSHSMKPSNAGPSVNDTKPKVGGQDADYFNSYSYNSIHEIMIKDKVRTDAYRDFIYDNKQLFQDKIVLDVGCGTGILSMFCAKAGAKMVIAVDKSDIIYKAKENVFRNGMQDVVHCLRGKIEEVALPVPRVDVIVSEWMGYCLLYESMLDSVIYARDRYLAPDGLMVPSHATLRIAPLADSDLVASHIDFWRDVYGFNMTSMLDKAHDEAWTRVVDAKELAAESSVFCKLDLHTVTTTELTFRKPFDLTWEGGFRNIDGFVIWFDIFFMRSRTEPFSLDTDVKEAQKKGIVAFSTGPNSPVTHWQQGVLLIRDRGDALSAGDKITGHVGYQKKEGQERSLDVEVAWKISSREAANQQTWFLD